MKIWAAAVGIMLGATGCNGCNDPAAKPDGPDPDAAIDARPDASPPRCDPSKPFGIPTPMTELNTGAQDIHAYFTPDELTVYFASSRAENGDWDIYQASRASQTAPFDAPVLVSGVNSLLNDSLPAITDDGLTLFGTRIVVTPSYETDIFSSTRTSISSAFAPLVYNPTFSSANRDEGIAFLPDRTAVFWSERAGSSGSHGIFTAVWNGTSYATPMPLYDFTFSDQNLVSGVLMTPDQLTLYFSSTKSLSQIDIWMTTRASTGVPFPEPTNVSELNSPEQEHTSWLSRDGCVIAFSRNNLTNSNSDLYLARKPQ